MAIKSGKELTERLEAIKKDVAVWAEIFAPSGGRSLSAKMEQALAAEGVPKIVAGRLAESMEKHMRTLTSSLSYIAESADGALSDLAEMRAEVATARTKPNDFVI